LSKIIINRCIPKQTKNFAGKKEEKKAILWEKSGKKLKYLLGGGGYIY
jgi:hypothetical protein